MAKHSKDVESINLFFEHLSLTESHWFLATPHLPPLKRNTAEVIARARELSKHATPVIAVRATVVLIALGEQPPLEILENGLLSESNFERMSAASLKDVLPKKPFPPLLEICERVAQRASNDYAASACLRMAMLLRGGATEQDLNVVRRLQDTIATYTFIDAASGDLRREGLRIFEQLLDRPDRRGQFDVAQYSERADESCVPRLWAILNEPERNPHYPQRENVKGALVRLKAPGIRDLLLSELDLKSNLTSQLRSLQELLGGSNDAEAIQRLLQLARSVRKGYYPRPDLALTIAAIGGPPTMPYVEELLEECKEDDRLRVLLQARDISLADAMAELHQIGMMTDAQFGKLKKVSKSRANLATKITETLESIGALYRFDAEFSGTPVPHDKLIVEFAEFAGSECDVDDVHQEGPEAGKEEGAYAVRFTLGSRQYHFTCGDQSDWYDHNAVVSQLNRALAEAGVEKRFVLAGLDGQYPQYVFVTPAAAAEAQRRGLMSMSV